MDVIGPQDIQFALWTNEGKVKIWINPRLQEDVPFEALTRGSESKQFAGPERLTDKIDLPH